MNTETLLSLAERCEQWTPGPWAGCIRFTPVGMDGDFNLAWLTTEPGSPRDIEARANAYLIRSAPDLYEALRQLVGNAEIAKAHLPNTDEAAIVSSALFDTIDQARAALRKARGEKVS